VLTGRDEVNIGDFGSYLKNRHEGQAISAVVPENILNDYLKRTYSVVLRDEYAPVDNLIAPVFEERFGYNRKDR
jgi:topoisomerase IA-like protein